MMQGHRRRLAHSDNSWEQSNRCDANQKSGGAKGLHGPLSASDSGQSAKTRSEYVLLNADAESCPLFRTARNVDRCRRQLPALQPHGENKFACYIC
jgi:hypothetical protein